MLPRWKTYKFLVMSLVISSLDAFILMSAILLVLKWNGDRTHWRHVVGMALFIGSPISIGLAVISVFKELHPGLSLLALGFAMFVGYVCALTQLA